MANRPVRLGRALLITLAIVACASSAHAQTSATDAASAPRRLVIANKPWTGDFDQMLARRIIRVYAPYSRSLYFNDRGRERGIAAELVRDWERYLNAKYAKVLGNRPLTIYSAPATRDRLLPIFPRGSPTSRSAT